MAQPTVDSILGSPPQPKAATPTVDSLLGAASAPAEPHAAAKPSIDSLLGPTHTAPRHEETDAEVIARNTPKGPIHFVNGITGQNETVAGINEIIPPTPHPVVTSFARPAMSPQQHLEQVRQQEAAAAEKMRQSSAKGVADQSEINAWKRLREQRLHLEYRQPVEGGNWYEDFGRKPGEQGTPLFTPEDAAKHAHTDEFHHWITGMGASALTGMAGLGDTLWEPVAVAVGGDKTSAGPRAFNQLVRHMGEQEQAEYEAQEKAHPSKPGVGKFVSETSQRVVGGIGPGILQWEMSLPGAILAGEHASQDRAAEQQRAVTGWEEAVDVALQSGGRMLGGKIMEADIGRITKGLGNAGIMSMVDQAERAITKRLGNESLRYSPDELKTMAADAAINFLIGSAAGKSDPNVKAARQAFLAGDLKQGMAHLNKAVTERSEVVARAARNLGTDLRGKPPETTHPEGKHTEPVKGKKLEAAKGVPVEERLDEPTSRRGVYDRAKASQAVRITHADQQMRIARKRLADTEVLWDGISDRSRMMLIHAYQEGGIAAVEKLQRDSWGENHREFVHQTHGHALDVVPSFKALEEVMREQARLEHEAGIEYDLRTNYVPGYWQDPAKVAEHYRKMGEDAFNDPENAAQNLEERPRAPSTGRNKPGFSRGKVFEDYQEGVEAGFTPTTTNPSVIAAMRADAGARAVSRHLGMQDMVEDGLAIPLTESTEAGKSRFNERRAKTQNAAAKEMVEAGFGRKVSEVNEDPNAPEGERAYTNVKIDGEGYAFTPDEKTILDGMVHKRMGGKSPSDLGAEDHPDWQRIRIAGREYLINPQAADIFRKAHGIEGPGLLDKQGVFDPNSKAGRITGGAWRGWMAARAVSIRSALTLSAFHAMHILGIQAAQPLAAASRYLGQPNGMRRFNDALSRMSSTRDSNAVGGYMSELFETPEQDLTPDERVLVNLFLAGGMTPGAASLFEARAHERLSHTLHDVIPSLQQEAEANGWNIARRWRMSKLMASTVVRGIGAALEHIEGPMFREFIPNLKNAAYINEALILLDTHPEMLESTPEATAQLREKLNDIRRSIDNRFGQMQYDKEFWPLLVKKAAFGSFLSTGWNWGFLREFVIGPGDEAVSAGKAALGKGEAKGSQRMIYAGAYTAIALMAGGLVTYAMTGQPPQDLKDMVYPRLPDGSRLTTMFFTREFGGAYYHTQQEGIAQGGEHLVTSKFNELMSAVPELLANQDYYGNQLYDPNAPFWTQVGQATSHASLSVLEPISFQGAQAHEDMNPDQVAMSFAGMNPAPHYIDMTPLQSSIMAAFHRENPRRPVPYEDVPRHTAIRELRQSYEAWKKDQDPDKFARFQKLQSDYQKKFPNKLKGFGRTLREMASDPEYAEELRMLSDGSQRAILRQMTPEQYQEYRRYFRATIREEYEREHATGLSP